MPTPSEKKLIHRKRAEGTVLVGILERLLENECIPEDNHDFRFLDMLVRARAIPRSKGVFSPSQLGSCQRQAWFSKRGTEKQSAFGVSTHGYFLKGNFVHMQWQFACWKAHRAGLLELAKIPAETEELGWVDAKGRRVDWRWAIEARVVDGDYGGTIDVIPIIDGRHYVVDFKGINLIDFQRTVKRGAKPEYRKQVVGYAKIANNVLGLSVEECLLVSECKAGPIHGGSPIALHETVVPVAEYEGEVQRRLKSLRYHDAKNLMPEIECVSTLHMGFQECAFNRYCQDEVRAVQREREARARKNAKPFTVARPNR